MTKYFAWIETSVGFQGQLWYDEPRTGEGKKKPPYFVHKLTSDEERFSLSELQRVFHDKKPAVV